jgi:hypothetical protein
MKSSWTLALLVMVSLAWLLILALTLLFFEAILPAFPHIHDIGVFTAVALLKIFLTLALGGTWVVVMAYVRRVFVRSRRSHWRPS